MSETSQTVQNQDQEPEAEVDPELLERVTRLGQMLTGKTPAQVATPTSRDLFCESPGFLPAILDPQLGWISPGSMVFAPEGASDHEQVVPFEGSIAMGGDEIVLEDALHLQVHEYSVSAFIPVVGPTLVRISGEEDLEQFFFDADDARTSGAFNEAIIHPLVELADRCALSHAHQCQAEDLRRIYVGLDGTVSAAAGGVPLGSIHDGFTHVEAAHRELDLGCAERCLGEVADTHQLVEELSSRPWISAYVQAVDAIRGLRAQGRENLRVSGFGTELATVPDDELADTAVDAGVVFLLDQDRVFLCRSNGRSFAMATEAGICLEAYNLTGSQVEAAKAVALHTGADVADVVDGVQKLIQNAFDSGMIIKELVHAGDK